jgi:hypothetical protein
VLYSLHAYLSSWLLACYPVMVSLCRFALILHVFGMVMDIIAQIQACVPCEAP